MAGTVEAPRVYRMPLIRPTIQGRRASVRAPMHALIAALLLAAPPEHDFSKVEIQTSKVAGSVWFLKGAGGNIFGMEIKPAPPPALPVVTFRDGLSLWWNGEEIRALAPGRGHTDGDLVVWFTKSNVVHFGDDFVTYGFPFVDLQSGGSVKGMIAALDVVLGQVPADAKVIPGHGEVSTIADVRKFRGALDEMVGVVKKGLAGGKSVEQLQKEHALAPWEPAWGGKDKFISAEAFIATIAQDLAAKK